MRGAPVRLRCEYLDNPMGVEADRPRLSWWLNDPRPAEVQTAYQIQAASSRGGLESGSADLWDTGYVSSQQTLNVVYRGRTLVTGDRVWWRVRCYDSDGTPSPWSGSARFEIGLLTQSDWHGRWIAAPLAGGPLSAVPAPVIYRDLTLDGRPVAARLYLSVLGSAIGEINGRPLCDDEPLGPWSDLGQRVAYRMFDVTELLRLGRNRIALLVGDGDYCGWLGGARRQRYGRQPAVTAQLVVELADGSRQVVVSNAEWRWFPSWVLQADRDRGETVDGRALLADWSREDGPDYGFPVSEQAHAAERVAQCLPPVRVMERLQPTAAPLRRRDAAGGTRLRYDFGRSLLGRIRLALAAPADAVVTVSYGDLAGTAGGDGEVCWEDAVDTYVARGAGTEVFEPRFALHAFRWIEVQVEREGVEIHDAVALQVASSALPTSGFRCDHRLLEALFDAAERTLRMGLALGPVRGLASTERRAAVAECEAILAGANACLDGAAIFQSWLSELAALQDAGGRLPACLPDLPGDVDDPAEVESLLPCLWLIYRCYGDRRLLEQHFPAVQRYLAGNRERWPSLIRGGADGTGSMREQMLGTAWYCYALSVATRMAGVLGRLEALEGYESLAERVRVAFRGRFLSRDGLLVEDDQLGYLLALELGLLEGTERRAALARLESQLRRRGFHADVDLAHGALLLEVLTLEGRVDLAYQLLLQTSAPGWLHPLTEQATTLVDEQAGCTRLAVSCVAGWLQRFLLGMEPDDNLTPELNAYRRMRIQPRPPVGEAFAAGPPVREAAGHLDTVHGRYECGWRLHEGGLDVEVRVPGNCAARVILPDRTEHLVVAGKHAFQVPQERLVGPAPAAADAPADGVPVLHQVSTPRSA